jgi:hypothetical protein
MNRAFAAGLAGAVVVALGWGGAARADARAPVGVFSAFDGSGALLAPLQASAPRPARPRLRLGEYHDDWSFSPDRSQVALGMGGQGNCGRGICIVSVRRMRIARWVPAPIAVEAVAWLAPRRIVGVLQRGGVIVADPVTGTIRRTTPLGFQVYAPPVARTSEGLVMLKDASLPRLARINADGDVSVAELPRIGPGAGLAAGGPRARAFVVSSGEPVAEVNLRTMGVRYHRVRMPGATGRLEALWLGRGKFAVTDVRGGVQVIDTRTWKARTVSRRATSARLAAGRLLVWSETERVGLDVFTRDGRRLVRHTLGKRELTVEVVGRNAYAFGPFGRRGRAWTVRARTGKLIRSTAPPPRGHELDVLSSPIGSAGVPR